jgi:hypothetical protein
MTVLVSDITTRVATILQDTTNVRWPIAELILWLNDSQREIVLYKPNAAVTNTTMQLVAGSKQTLPVGANALVKLTRNMGTNGTTPGNAIRLVSRNILDSQVPTWSSDPGSAVTVHYLYDDLDPLHFYVWPQSLGTSYVELVYAGAPTDCTLGGNYNMPDIFMMASINYMLFRAYSKDADFALNTQLANQYYAAFNALLGGKTASETAVDPNKSAAGNTAVI